MKQISINYFIISSFMKSILYYMYDNVKIQVAMKQNSKGSLKVINAKISSPLSTIKTPVSHTAQAGCLTERINKMISPTTNRKQMSTQRKVISIDLKVSKKQSKQHCESNKLKKVIKVRRKTESVDVASTKQGSKAGMSACSSEKRLQNKNNKVILNQKLKCFDQISSYQLGFDMKTSRKKIQHDWDQIVQGKKHELYSQLYKMDKKIFALERDLDQLSNIPSKKTMMEIIKKKTTISKENNPTPIQIHSNIYKMGKNRAMKDQ